jgi:hypothetical protein
MVDEAERSLHDALSVLSQTVKETRVVLGGGSSEMLMSCAVDQEARTIKGKKAIAAEAFARALRQIPTILADNAGYDSSDLVSKLRAAHYEGQQDAGLGSFWFSPSSVKQLSDSQCNPRHGTRKYWINDRAGCYGELQIEAPGRKQRHGGGGNDHTVRVVDLRNHVLLIDHDRVDDILRATPRKREAV